MIVLVADLLNTVSYKMALASIMDGINCVLSDINVDRKIIAQR